MKTKLYKTILFLVISCGVLHGERLWAQSPFDDGSETITVKKAKVEKSEDRITPPSISIEDLQKAIGNAGSSNVFAKGDYKNFVVGFPTGRVKITFADINKSFDRASWFQQICAEHGCQIMSFNKEETTSGSWLSGKTVTRTVTSTIKGRVFVIAAIAEHYQGGQVQQPDKPSIPDSSLLSNVVDLEMRNRDIELQILRLSFEVDKNMVAKSKLGFSITGNLRANRSLDTLIDDLMKKQIPAMKLASKQTTNAIRQDLVRLGSKAQNQKDFSLAISLYDVSASKADDVIANVGNSYLGLNDYDSAIRQFKKLAPNNPEMADNGIAEAQHAKGNDREALDSLYKVLRGFKNSAQELEALEKLDKWGYLNRSEEFPEIPGMMSQTYLKKGVLDYSTNQDLAAEDFKKAVEIRANGGSKDDAAKAILNESREPLSQKKILLLAARKRANMRFEKEREDARVEVYAHSRNFAGAVGSTRTFNMAIMELISRDLTEANRELDLLLSHPPASTGDDEKYNAAVEAARYRVGRLEGEYRKLNENPDSKFHERMIEKTISLREAKAEFDKYDLSRKEAYINSDSEVSRLSSPVSNDTQVYEKMAKMAKAAGY